MILGVLSSLDLRIRRGLLRETKLRFEEDRGEALVRKEHGLKSSKVRVRLELALAACAGILNIFWHDWIEAMTG